MLVWLRLAFVAGWPSGVVQSSYIHQDVRPPLVARASAYPANPVVLAASALLRQTVRCYLTLEAAPTAVVRQHHCNHLGWMVCLGYHLEEAMACDCPCCCLAHHRHYHDYWVVRVVACTGLTPRHKKCVPLAGMMVHQLDTVVACLPWAPSGALSLAARTTAHIERTR